MKNHLQKVLKTLMSMLGYSPSITKVPIEIFLQQIEGHFTNEVWVPVELCTSVKVHACLKKSEDNIRMTKAHLSHDMSMNLQKYATYETREIRDRNAFDLGKQYTEHIMRIKILVKK